MSGCDLRLDAKGSVASAIELGLSPTYDYLFTNIC